MGGLLHLVQRGGAWAEPQPAQAPPRCTKCISPPINGQCTNFVLLDVPLILPLESKGLIAIFPVSVEYSLRYYTQYSSSKRFDSHSPTENSGNAPSSDYTLGVRWEHGRIDADRSSFVVERDTRIES